MHGGAIWVRPDWRRNGLTRIVSRICAAYALTRWDTQFTWGLVEPRLHAGGLSQAYGPHQVAEGVTLRLPFRGVSPRVLIWMSRAALLADLARSLDREAVIPSEGYAHQQSFVPGTAPRQG